MKILREITKIVIAASIGFIVNMYYTDAQIERYSSDAVSYLSSMPKIEVVDIEAITKTMLEEEIPPAKVAEYVELLVRVKEVKGVLVIDTKSVVTTPKLSVTPTLSYSDLKAQAKIHGIESELDYEALLEDFNGQFK
ncbi:hypothetical protein AN214_03910 [Pseudoalteromonas sp. P1-9]|uniref:hypothetical protein n=1 Tax=Pseudoalteromonas sp. P1-9 TaxID=1710354 RepID=UPI0006D5D4A7|nr:hypothetical protein [Pseudoalteromonas sp. P1-9]KPV94077.1 hypothetical protein AN214_03910 [Pseudoalteromonas sp. P1-9]